MKAAWDLQMGLLVPCQGQPQVFHLRTALLFLFLPLLFFVMTDEIGVFPYVFVLLHFHFMSKSHEENIFDQISLTFLSFLVNSRGCCLLNIDYQIKFCTETEYIKFMFKQMQNFT